MVVVSRHTNIALRAVHTVGRLPYLAPIAKPVLARSLRCLVPRDLLVQTNPWIPTGNISQSIGGNPEKEIGDNDRGHSQPVSVDSSEDSVRRHQQEQPDKHRPEGVCPQQVLDLRSMLFSSTSSLSPSILKLSILDFVRLEEFPESTSLLLGKSDSISSKSSDSSKLLSSVKLFSIVFIRSSFVLSSEAGKDDESPRPAKDFTAESSISSFSTFVVIVYHSR
ncbi:unnamed protein product [Pseudo-nitzschia multistriata]|uniref:Uncharacterized protein n=1 Tax=Pseudo-nitzschia multistriata TaxID=183589 RepID=A0A448ZH92_9STRA|nr:unnamed protein product [Pseudo-nitzschia multistriata]